MARDSRLLSAVTLPFHLALPSCGQLNRPSGLSATTNLGIYCAYCVTNGHIQLGMTR